jgi:restriction system protein
MNPVASQSSGNSTHVIFHYPPELLQLLKDTIPLLCRSKKDVLVFFRGAGVDDGLVNDLRHRVDTDRQNISKFEIARVTLERLSEGHQTRLRELREVVRRVVEYEDFSTCWPEDVLKAKGLVSEVRRVVEVKDSFTRIRQEKEAEANARRSAADQKAKVLEERRQITESVRKDFFGLFALEDAVKRGKALESVLNRLFAAHGMLVREAFTVKGHCGEGIVEQIDGVVEIDSYLYLVEMKWWNKPLGQAEIAPHLVRVYGRGSQARGIFISYTNFTEPAISTCRDAIAGGAIVVLCKLQELVDILIKYEDGVKLEDVLKNKINAAILDRQPFQEFKN